LTSLAAAQARSSAVSKSPGVQGDCGPKLNEEHPMQYWVDKAKADGNLAPQAKLANEKPQGETIDYDTLIKSWPATRPRRADGSQATRSPSCGDRANRP